MAAKEFRGANNRAYYGIYHAISAVHALDGNAYKRHKDAVANFNKDYVKTSVFPREMGRKIGQAEEIRHASDYDDFYIASKEEARAQAKNQKRIAEDRRSDCKGAIISFTPKKQATKVKILKNVILVDLTTGPENKLLNCDTQLYKSNHSHQ